MQALHNGAWLVLDFDTVDCDLASYFDKVPLASLLISPGFVGKCCVPLNPMVNDHYPY